MKCAINDRDASARSEGQCAGCDDTVIQGVLSLMLEQRDASAKSYEDAGHLDMADREREEIEVIQRYLPQEMCKEELKSAVTEVVTELDASGLKDLGKCISTLKERYPETLDAKLAGKLVKEALR